MKKFYKINEDSKYFDFAIELIFSEWGDGDKTHLEKKKQIAKNDKLTHCYVLEVDGKPVGAFIICVNDIKGYTQYNPNLACVCVDKKFRGLGYSWLLMNYVDVACKELNIDTLYLKTTLKNFYEKFGWEFVEDITINGIEEKVLIKHFNNK